MAKRGWKNERYPKIQQEANENYLDYVHRKSRAEELIAPKTLATSLGLTRAEHSDLSNALLAQYQVAKNKGDNEWIEEARKEAQIIWRDGWIRENMPKLWKGKSSKSKYDKGKLPSKGKSPSKAKSTRKPSSSQSYDVNETMVRDARLLINPNLPIYRSDAAEPVATTSTSTHTETRDPTLTVSIQGDPNLISEVLPSILPSNMSMEDQTNKNRKNIQIFTSSKMGTLSEASTGHSDSESSGSSVNSTKNSDRKKKVTFADVNSSAKGDNNRSKKPAGKKIAPGLTSNTPAGKKIAPRDSTTAGKKIAPRDFTTAGKKIAPRDSTTAVGKKIAPSRNITAGKEIAPRDQIFTQYFFSRKRKMDDSPRKREVAVQGTSEEMVVLDECGASETEVENHSETEVENQSDVNNNDLDPDLPEAYDSHFHLDRTSCKLFGRDTAYVEVEQLLEHSSGKPEYPVNVVGGVCVFSEPSRQPIISNAPLNWKAAVGAHPKHVEELTPARFNTLKSLVRSPDVCALGEIGLDRTVPVKEWRNQDLVFERILSGIAVPDKPIILHLRGQDKYGADVHARALGILRRKCSRTQRLHIHCFTGTADMVQDWLEEFPHAYFGFTAIVRSFDTEQVDALKAVPSNRLLLETDSPYMPVSGQNVNTPAFIGDVATIIARTINVEVLDILARSVRNGQSLYGQ